MSKKNLSRTAIEGGRTGRSKWNRRNSHNIERASERDYCRRLEVDPDIAYDDEFITEKEQAWKDFNDKLNPMFRWLGKQTGRPWDEVLSEIKQKFDTRTTAGRHIVNDHLLRSVQTAPEYRSWYYGPEDETTSHSQHAFYVDAEGILQKKRYIPRHGSAVPKWDTQDIADWLKGRIVGKVGNKLFWFVPATKNKKYRGYNHEWKTEWKYWQYDYYGRHGLKFLYLSYDPVYTKDKDGNRVITEYKSVWKESYGVPTLRQGYALNKEELKYWNIIPVFYQEKVLEHSPTNPNPPKKRYA